MIKRNLWGHRQSVSSSPDSAPSFQAHLFIFCWGSKAHWLAPLQFYIPIQHLFRWPFKTHVGNKVCSSLMPEFAAWIEWWGEFEKLPCLCYWVPVNLSWAACTRPSLPLKGFPLTLNNYGSSITWIPIIMTRPGQHWTWFHERLGFFPVHPITRNMFRIYRIHTFEALWLTRQISLW